MFDRTRRLNNIQSAYRDARYYIERIKYILNSDISQKLELKSRYHRRVCNAIINMINYLEDLL